MATGEVEKAVEDLTKAMLSADTARLSALLAEPLSYGHSNGKVESKADVVDVIGNRKTIYKRIQLSETSVVMAGTSAVARQIFDNETETAGKAGSARVGVMQVWVKEGGAWKLLARQAFRLGT